MSRSSRGMTQTAFAFHVARTEDLHVSDRLSAPALSRAV